MRAVVLGGLAFAWAAGAVGQGYSPGQSFGSSGQNQPASGRATPASNSTIPYQVQSQGQAQRQAQPYNLSTPTPRPRPRATPKPVVRKQQEKPKPTRTPVSSAPAMAELDAKPHKTPEVAKETKRVASSTGSPGAKYITEWPTGKKLIALTYDDGPDARYTPKLLDYLAEAKVPATFYLCGNRVQSAPEPVARMVAEGHEVANHTWDHPLLTKLSAEKARTQLTSTQEQIAAAAPGAKVTTMRPPFGGGAATTQLQGICEDLGYKIVLWDIDTEDWRKRPASQMINNILKNARDGSIVLMHDRVHGGRDTIMETTRAVVPALRERGFTFVTVADMLSRPHVSKAGSGGADATTATVSGEAPSPTTETPEADAGPQ